MRCTPSASKGKGAIRGASGRAQVRNPALEAALAPEATALLALFRVVFRSVRQHNRYIEERSGIGALPLRALAIVDARPRIGVTALASTLLVHQPTASKLVDTLFEAGQIVRHRSARDGRAVELAITSKGRATLAGAPGPVLGILLDGLGALDPASQRRLERALQDLLRAMQIDDLTARYEPLSDA